MPYLIGLTIGSMLSACRTLVGELWEWAIWPCVVFAYGVFMSVLLFITAVLGAPVLEETGTVLRKIAGGPRTGLKLGSEFRKKLYEEAPASKPEPVREVRRRRRGGRIRAS